MLKLYRQSQAVQYKWIRNHPVQYVTLNVVLAAGYIGYVLYQDRKIGRELDAARAQHDL